MVWSRLYYVDHSKWWIMIHIVKTNGLSLIFYYVAVYKMCIHRCVSCLFYLNGIVEI